MSKSNLNETLKAARIPKRREGYWENFSGLVVRQLGRIPAPMRNETPWFPRIAWGFAAAAVCLVAGFAIGHWRGRDKAVSTTGLLQNEKVIRETMAMFPNRIRAIVQDDKGVSLVLSEKEDVPDSTPLYVKVCDGTHCSALVTFSGQEVQLAGQKVTVLSNARGGVMIVGEQFLWSSEQNGKAAAHLRIEAKELVAIGAG